MQPIKIISLNIEFNKHYQTIFPFIFAENPDVVLLQEVLKEDLPLFEKNLAMDYKFAPLAKLRFSDGIKILGQATFSKLKIIKSEVLYYRGKKDKLKTINIPLIDRTEPEKMIRAILVVFVEKDGQQFCLINTHFTWSDMGIPTQSQENDLDKMIKLLSKYKDFVLCGDFNAPRGMKVFDKLASIYKDNIPKEITTTIDKNLHHAGNLGIVVDGLFTTKRYMVEYVKLVDGVSDHKAIIANIIKP